jgi:hypothetical protein
MIPLPGAALMKSRYWEMLVLLRTVMISGRSNHYKSGTFPVIESCVMRNSFDSPQTLQPPHI